MADKYFTLIFALTLVGLVVSVYKYSKDGDIATFKNGTPSPTTMLSLYPTQELTVQRMHDLLIYKESYVRWNRYLVLSIFAAFIIMKYHEREMKTGNLIVLSSFIFLIIDLPNRWANAHIQKGIVQEATQLHSLYAIQSAL